MTATTVSASVRDSTRAWLTTAAGSAVGRLIAIWLILAVALTLLTPTFLTVGNFLLIAQSVAISGVAAVGLTVAVISGSVDLSFPAIISVTTSSLALLLKGGTTEIVAIALVLGVGLLIGLANGVLSRSLRIDALLLTLATYTFLREALFILTSGQTTQAQGSLIEMLGRSTFAGIPILVITLAVVGLVAAVVLHWTVGGQWLSAVGGNPAAATYSGIPTYRVAVLALGVSGLTAAIAGVMLTGLVGFASTNNGDVYLLPVIAAVVLSGASLAGGRGSIVATLIAVAILGTLTNGMNILRIDPFVQQMVNGLVLLGGLVIYGLRGSR